MATPATRTDSPSPIKESEETSPLSRLRQYPQTKPNWNYEPSLSLRKRYSSTAESVQKLLIYELTFWNDSNVEALVDLANNAFASLDWLHADYSDLYAAVRDFISYYSQYSEARKELKRNQNDVENLCAEALNKADAELELTKQVEEKREIVRKLKPLYDEAEAGVEQSTNALLSFWKE